jgi:Domain of unknown function DUF29
MADARTLYDDDFVAWTEQQAEALRSAARGSTNQPLDWENLAEEIESLGISQRHELRSQIQRIIRHLLKLEHSPAVDPRRGWVETINDARTEIELLIEDSPSLKNELGRLTEAELARGSRVAIRDLEKYGEVDTAIASSIRRTRYTEDQVIGDWFPPDLAPPSRRKK